MCPAGLHWSPPTTLRRWPQQWDGAPVVVSANLSIHPPACSPVSLALPFGNHSTWFGQLPHVHSSPRCCLNSSSSHLSCDGLKGMLQPPHGPGTVIRCSDFCWQPIKKAVPSHCASVCGKACKKPSSASVEFTTTAGSPSINVFACV